MSLFKGLASAQPLVRDRLFDGDNSFFAILVQSFGFSATESLLYTAPAGAVTLICVVSCLYLGDRFKREYSLVSCSSLSASSAHSSSGFCRRNTRLGD